MTNVAIKSVTAAGNNGSTATVSVTTSESPAATQVGDLVIVIHGNDFYTLANMVTPTATGSPTMNAITNGSVDAGTNQAHIKAYWYVANTAGAQTVSTTETGSHDEEKCLVVYVLSAADTTTPIDGGAAGAAGNFSAANANPHIAPAVIPVGADAFLICHVNTGGGLSTTSYTPPAGMTEQYDGLIGAGINWTGATLQLSGSGSTGTKTFTPAAGNPPYAALSLAIKTASGGGGAAPEYAAPWRLRAPGRLSPASRMWNPAAGVPTTPAARTASQAESVTLADTASAHVTLARALAETVHLVDTATTPAAPSGNWWTAVAAAAAGTGRARYVVVGDSYVDGVAASDRAHTFAAKLAGDVRTSHTIAGSGLGLLNFDEATGHTGTVVDDDTQTQSAGAKMTGTATVTWTITGTSFDIVYRETPGANAITVKVDGSTVGTITHPGSGSNVHSKAWNHVIGSGGSHTVQVLTTDAQFIDGVIPYNSDTAAVGLSYIKCGRSGTQTNYWTSAVFPAARDGWNQFLPDLVVVEPTINDCLNDVALVDTAANITDQVTYCLALPSNPTVLYIAPFFTNYAPFADDGSSVNGLGLKLDAYRAAALAAASAAGAMTLDMRVAIPDPVGSGYLDTGHPNDAGHAAYAQAISDFLDANTPPAASSRSQSDSVTLADAVTRSSTKARGQADSAQVADTAARVATHPRAVADGATFGDTVSAKITRVRGLSESVTAGDTTDRQLGAARAVSDAATLADVTTPSQLGNLSRSQSEGVTAADGQARALAQARATADSTTVADAVVRVLARSRSLSDALTAGDTTARALAEARALSDAVTLSDTTSASSAGNLARGVSDSLTTADAAARRLQAARQVTEPLQVADALAAASTRARATTEAFTVADVLTRSLGRARSLAETVTATDTTARGALVLGRSTAEPVTLADLAAAGTVQARALLEQLQLGDVTVGSVFDPSTLREITMSASLVRGWDASLAPRNRDAELTDRPWRAIL